MVTGIVEGVVTGIVVLRRVSGLFASRSII